MEEALAIYAYAPALGGDNLHMEKLCPMIMLYILQIYKYPLAQYFRQCMESKNGRDINVNVGLAQREDFTCSVKKKSAPL